MMSSSILPRQGGMFPVPSTASRVERLQFLPKLFRYGRGTRPSRYDAGTRPSVLFTFPGYAGSENGVRAKGVREHS